MTAGVEVDLTRSVDTVGFPPALYIKSGSLPVIAGLFAVWTLRDKLHPRVFRIVAFVGVLAAAVQLIIK